MYLDANGLIEKSLINDTGDKNVKDLAEYLAKDEGESKKISINQVRKFYDTFLKIYHNNSLSDEKKIQLIMLKAQVEYAVKRLKIYNFGKFFDNRINILVKSENEIFLKNLDAFKLHFEALIGYFPK
jgi:CRISPR type III-A-associated protein Csm2